MAWFALGWLGLNGYNRLSQTLAVDTFTCCDTGERPVRVEADGQYLSHAPMTVTLVPNALRLLLRPERPGPSS